MRKHIFKSILVLFIVLGASQAVAMSRPPAKVVAPIDSIGVRTLKYEDETRSRPVIVELWYPVDAEHPVESLPNEIYLHPKESREAPLSKLKAKYPLILMSHGNRGDRRDRSWLAEKLVKANYIVASVEHYGNSYETFNPLLTLKYWERAKDITFVLDQLLEDPLLAQKIDENKIGFTGYSLGGMTGLALAGGKVDSMEEVIASNKSALPDFPEEVLAQVDFSEAHCEHCEPRIKAMLLIAPANFLYKPSALEKIQVPVGLVSAVNDEILPHNIHSSPIIQHIVPVKLKVLRKEISHFSFLNPISELGKSLLPDKYKEDTNRISREAIHQEVGDFGVEFFDEAFKR